jgi:hypothetical protein
MPLVSGTKLGRYEIVGPSLVAGARAMIGRDYNLSESLPDTFISDMDL